MHLLFDKPSRKWRLYGTEEQLSNLAVIPGVRLSRTGDYAHGPIDAMEAAARVNGLQLQDPGTNEFKACLSPKSELPLRPFQHVGVSQIRDMLWRHGGAILADEMGLGKSLQAIALSKQLAQRTLICCPRFVSENWKAELNKWGEQSVASPGPGTTKRIKAEWEKASTSKYVITSYELSMKVLATCFTTASPDMLILDEAHMIKNVKAERTQNILAMGAMIPYRLALTATPIWNRPFDFHGLLTCLFGDRFGSRTAFASRYCGGSINAYGGITTSGLTNEAELKQRLSHYMLRREKKDVLKELPSLTRQVIWLEPNENARKAFVAATLKQTKAATFTALAATAEAKAEAAVHLATEAGRFLLFTYERAWAERLHKQLAKCNPVLIHGGFDVSERQRRIEQAKNTNTGIVATIDSLGMGVNLQGVASTGIFHVLDWSPQKLAQAEARIHRMGQTNNVTWYYLACRDSMDEPVVHTIVEKLDQTRAVLGFESNRDLRDALNGHVGGPTDEDLLRSIYDGL